MNSDPSKLSTPNKNWRQPFIDKDGYLVQPEQPTPKGVKCGKCGVTFDYGKSVGYYCGKTGCPIQLQTTA